MSSIYMADSNDLGFRLFGVTIIAGVLSALMTIGEYFAFFRTIMQVSEVLSMFFFNFILLFLIFWLLAGEQHD